MKCNKKVRFVYPEVDGEVHSYVDYANDVKADLFKIICDCIQQRE
jgi:hypothetical protein